MINKFKRLKTALSRVLAGTLAGLMIAGAASPLSTSIVTDVHAEDTHTGSVDRNQGLGKGYDVTDGKKHIWHDDSALFYLDGHSAFCVEPYNMENDINGATYNYMNDAPENIAGYAAIADLKGGTFQYKMAAQFLIWQALGNTVTPRGTMNVTNEMADIQNTYDTMKSQGYEFTGKEYIANNGAQKLVSFAVGEVPTVDVPVSVKVNKSSACTSVSDSNPNYSLAGAEFRVDVTGKATDSQTITTDANGNATYSHTFAKMPKGTTAADFKITVTETKAPKGYLLDKTPQTVVSGGTAYFKDQPINDPAGLNITKKPSNNDEVTNVPSLAGAKFTFKYYAVDPNSVNSIADLNGKTYETWTGTTSQTRSGNYRLDWSDVKGNNHKTVNGNTTIPVGVLTIEETEAPAGYTLNNQTLDVNGKNVTTENGVVLLKIMPDSNSTTGARITYGNEYTVEENMIRGRFSLVKNNENLKTNIAEGDNNLSAKFALYNRNDYPVTVDVNGDGKIDKATETFQPNEVIRDRSKDDNTKKIQCSFVTDENGNYTSPEAHLQQLMYGKYEIVEIEAPVNNTKDANSHTTFTIGENNVIVKNELSNEVVTGKVELYKHVNKQSGSEFDDSAENGAQFLVILSSKLDSLYDGDMQKAWNALKDKKGQNILDANGRVILSNREFDILTTGTETNADGQTLDGYALSSDLATGEYTMMQFVSGTAKGFKPEDLKMADEAKTFNITAKKTTDANGYNEWSAWKDIERGNKITVTNDEKLYTLRILKKDASTKKLVTLNSASFKVIVDADGDGKLTAADMKYNSVNSDGDIDYTYYKDGSVKIVNGYVTMTSGGKDYDTFRTYSDNVGKIPAGTFVVSELNGTENDKGSAVQPVRLKKGTYFIVETDGEGQNHATPYGYTKKMVGDDVQSTDDGTNYIKFEVNGSHYLDNNGNQVASETKDSLHNSILNKAYSWFDNATQWVKGTKRLEVDDDYFVTETVYNERVFGTLNIKKSIADKDKKVDYSMINRDDLSGIKFRLTATKDVIDPADGTVITKAGDVAKTWDAQQNKYIVTGEFNVNKDGSYTLNNIPLGEYKLEEIEVPAGIVKTDKTWNYVFSQKDEDNRQTAEYKTHEDIVNTPTTTEIIKDDVDGNTLAGAKLSILDSEGNVVYSFISEPNSNDADDNYVIEGLPVGKYKLHEDAAPGGYVLNDKDIDFEVVNSPDTVKVKMVNTFESFAKRDGKGNLLNGASFEVTNKEGKVIDSWVSGQHIVDMTSENIQKLRLKNNVQFTKVSNDGTASIYMISPVKNSDDFRLIKEVVGVTNGTPNEKDVKSVDYYYIDSIGNETTHLIRNLTVNTDYTIKEVKSVEGYYYDEDIAFNNDGTKNGEHFMTDNEIDYKVAKVDDDGNFVKGVTLKLTDTTDNTDVELPNNGVTTDKPFELNGVLKPDHAYELTETDYVGGVYKAASIKFTVPHVGSSNITTITMQDIKTYIDIAKVDDTGAYLSGAKLAVYRAVKDENGKLSIEKDKDGKELDPVLEFTSTYKPFDASKYLKGSNDLAEQYYVLRELEAPYGYGKAEDIYFTVKGDKNQHQRITMIDSGRHYFVSAIKVDATDHSKKLAGATISFYKAIEETVAKDVGGATASGVTDGKGAVTFEMAYDPYGYYVRETNAPEGYNINKKKFGVTLASDYNFAKDNPIEIIVDDTPKNAPTSMEGKSITGGVIAVTAGVAVALAYVIVSQTKKKKEKEEAERLEREQKKHQNHIKNLYE